MTKRKARPGEAEDIAVDPLLEDTYRLIRLAFVHNAKVIAENNKPETLLKMIQSCKQLNPVDKSNKELWKLIQKVRRDVMGVGTVKAGKTKARRSAGKRG